MRADNKLKEYRTGQGLSMQELYAMSGVSPNTLVMIERYSHLPKPQTRQRLAKALQVDESILFPEVE